SKDTASSNQPERARCIRTAPLDKPQLRTVIGNIACRRRSCGFVDFGGLPGRTEFVAARFELGRSL
ncbi:MAG: hypothetical protein KIT82_18515, partial [Bradyrhizobium sp.]|nr:hypothetical protein [Bradyrhizobium sp.]